MHGADQAVFLRSETIDAIPTRYEVLARQFLRYADTEYRNASPLYEHLARCIAGDEAILALAAHASPEQLNQTNEVGRCTYLMPAFALISKLAGGCPLALIEIGTSPGLNLMWNHYRYDHGPGMVCGNPQSPVQLSCTLRGEHRPPLPAQMPNIELKV